MEKAFVFFTSKESLTTTPVALPESKLFGFDDNKIIGVSKNKSLIANEEIPYFVLIKDSITLQNPNEQGEEHGNSKELLNLLKRTNEIYLVIHKNKPSNYLDTFQRLFKERLRCYIFHSHITDSIYYRVLKPAIESDSLTDLSSLEATLVKEFPNNQLESLIHLHKSLSFIPLMLKNGAFTNENLKTELSLIQSAKRGKVDLALQKYKTSEITTENFNDKLTTIAEEIKTLSTSG